MKNLRLRGEWISFRREVRVTVLERPVSDMSFGNQDDDEWFMGGGCCFIPSSYYTSSIEISKPKINSDDGLLDVTIGSRGSYFHCSSEQWEVVKQGVSAYNEWGIDK